MGGDKLRRVLHCLNGQEVAHSQSLQTNMAGHVPQTLSPIMSSNSGRSGKTE